jgi:hypothetical protein
VSDSGNIYPVKKTFDLILSKEEPVCSIINMLNHVRQRLPNEHACSGRPTTTTHAATILLVEQLVGAFVGACVCGW